ncbi:phosphodiesterase YaeI [Pseudooceanicola marinus]|uniref:Phosphodiesterase YaeI n=1 Tax=Pseudooceanicola marinus TaxID=396013 RepID=A0A1X6ZM42_9RHOB|nr:metallophosphoesterase [Pseudooceanicola marinus]PJE26596.1 phosphodiesterase [Pseudooceanicola marinus]SLN55345.1 phosphodiesterase YaeI [Pseudooceanicola marinus]
MKRILHLSDLHFGRARPDLEAPLLAAIARNRPDLVVVSGDFTQRARHVQFRRAQDFLAKLPAPVLSVPGNHDTPLDRPFERLLAPFRRYRRYVDEDTEPVFSDGKLTVVGVNTVNPLAWQQGKFSSRARDRVARRLAEHPADLSVVVVHHPLEHGPKVDKRLMRGARAALAQLSDCGADVVLSGHLHRASSAPFRAAPGLLFVQAGTGLSSRTRGDDNTFNLLDWEETGALRVTTWGARGQGAQAVFAPEASAMFRREGRVWARQPAAPGAAALSRRCA